MKKVETPINYIVQPDTWEKRYDVHKYWGKKPSNVVAHYINYFTEEGDKVLDLFSGFGVTVIESVVNNRIGIGVDINPISKYICTSLIEKVNLDHLDDEFYKMKNAVIDEIEWLYSTICPHCNESSKIVSTVWEGNQPVEIKYECNFCNSKGRKTLTEEDKIKIKEINDTEIPYWYPNDAVFKGWQTKKLIKAGLTSFSQIYTHRNLFAISTIFDKISKIKDENIKKVLVVTFTSMIAQASRMIADYKKSGGGPSWKINTYWIPKRWQELNAWHYFENRYEKMVKGKRETNGLISNPRYCFYTQSSTNIRDVIENESIDYIFTDPPYGGEAIQYLELSFIWNCWLAYFSEEIDWKNEVIFNPHRDDNFNEQRYEDKLKEVFSEAFRVLKDRAWMSVTFANKDLKVWNSLINAFKQAGFQLINIIPMEASAPNITQMLLKEAPKTDLIINLRKVTQTENNVNMVLELNLKDSLEEAADRLIKENGRVSLSKLFDTLLIKWLTIKYSHVNEDEQLIEFDKSTIEKLMKENPKYKVFICEDTNNRRQQADIEWKLSEN